MNLISAVDPYESLRPIMRRCGATGTAREFYWAVNQAYHTVEARQYDDLHESMFVGLEPIWSRLLARASSHPQSKLRVLDVGAGTGLVGSFIEMHLADRVARLTLLDPCAAMLEKCQGRAALFSFPCEFRQGDVHALGEDERFDVITVNSVLHHIVELRAFFARVRHLLSPQGWLLAAHDPRAEAAEDESLCVRRQQRRRAHRNLAQSAWRRLGRLLRIALGRAAGSPLALETSTCLLNTRVIQAPLTMASIYAVTDFHVPGQPGKFGKGIRLDEMEEWLSGLTLAESLTYQFQGAPWISLTRAEQEQEMRWLAERDPHGELMASAWCRNACP